MMSMSMHRHSIGVKIVNDENVHAPAQHRYEEVQVENDVHVPAPAKHRCEEVDVENDVNAHLPARHRHGVVERLMDRRSSRAAEQQSTRRARVCVRVRVSVSLKAFGWICLASRKKNS